MTPLRIVFTALLPFASGYLMSYLLRAVNAVVAPDLVRDAGLSPAELGLLTAAYLGAFALFQLPLGVLLDRYGPRRVQSVLLLVAAMGVLGFAAAPGVFVAFAAMREVAPFVLKLVAAWMVAAAVMAIRQALDYRSTGRAIVVCVLAWLLTFGTLAAALKKLGAIDLVLTGRQAADGDTGVVGAGIGELLNLPVLTFAKSIAVDGKAVRVERVLDDGGEIVEADLPAVVTVSNEIGAPRAASLRETMRAARKPVVVWNASDLGLEANAVGAAGSRAVRECVFAPSKSVQCEIIEASSPEAQGAQLAQRLREARVL